MKKLFIILTMALLLGQALTFNGRYLVAQDDDFIDLHSERPMEIEV